jgi:hypothetical protein
LARAVPNSLGAFRITKGAFEREAHPTHFGSKNGGDDGGNALEEMHEVW